MALPNQSLPSSALCRDETLLSVSKHVESVEEIAYANIIKVYFLVERDDADL